MQTFAGGEKVRILDSVFAHFSGIVSGVNAQQKILAVALTVFGRDLTIDLRFAQVQKAA